MTVDEFWENILLGDGGLNSDLVAQADPAFDLGDSLVIDVTTTTGEQFQVTIAKVPAGLRKDP